MIFLEMFSFGDFLFFYKTIAQKRLEIALGYLPYLLLGVFQRCLD